RRGARPAALWPTFRSRSPPSPRRDALSPLVEEQLYLAEEVHAVALHHHGVCALTDHDHTLQWGAGQLAENRLRHVRRRIGVPVPSKKSSGAINLHSAD